jgi:single-strand DNA-binding protein
VAVFNEGLVKVIENYVNKGDKILVEGQLRTRKWTDNNNVERYSTEVTLGGRDSNLILLGNSRRDGGSAASSDAGAYEPGADLDDQVPF